MHEGVASLIWLTGAVLGASMVYGFVRCRDPLHPVVYINPMLAYVYFMTPAILVRQGLLETCFPQGADVGYAQAVILGGVTAFCLGALNFGIVPGLSLRRSFRLTEPRRRAMRRLSFLIGGIGLIGYYWLLQRHGGLSPVYGRPKGGFYGVSGYLASAPLLTIPATLLYLLSHFGRRRGWRQVLVCMVLMSPHLLHALLGARRGTAFLAFGSLFFGWYVTRPRRPSLGLSVAALVALGFLMFFLGSQRTRIYLGADFYFDRQAFLQAVSPEEIDVGNTTVYSWGLILASREAGHHFWGRRYLAQVFIRPIPRQLWRGKYRAVGLQWMETAPGSGGMSEMAWLNAVGWYPQAGSAAGLVADAYLEFGLLGLVVCYLVGRVYSALWKRAVVLRGVWNLLYAEAAAISVFMPTQGVTTAWLYRLLFLGIPTWALWKWIAGRHGRPRDRWSPRGERPTAG